MLKNLKQLPNVFKHHTLVASPIGACMFHSSKPLRKPNNFINNQDSAYLERMYNSWIKDKKSVGASWDNFFSTEIQAPKIDAQSSVNTQRAIADSMRVLRLIKAYQRRGHELADLDPLSRFAAFSLELI